MKITVEVFRSFAKCSFKGNEKLVFTGIQTVQEAIQSELTWIKPSDKTKSFVNSTKASGIICDELTYTMYDGDKEEKLFILTEDPKLIFVNLVKYVSKQNEIKKTRLIHPTAIIDDACELGKNVEIGAYSIIGACKIGENTIIHDHVKIFDPVTIGRNCVIREFCSIGGEGFGYFKTTENTNEHIPHIGSVLIGDNVEIYPYSNVDRGTLGKTEIKNGTVIDHYVHIGHNSITGKDNIIAAGCVLAGGSQVKDNCFLGVHTVLKQKCVIESNVVTGMGAVVVKDVAENSVVVGNPAKLLKSKR